MKLEWRQISPPPGKRRRNDEQGYSVKRYQSTASPALVKYDRYSHGEFVGSTYEVGNEVFDDIETAIAAIRT